MTLIIGKLHPDGLVISADTEETLGTAKRSCQKLFAYTNNDVGSLVIGGAGPGPIVDELSQLLFRYFGNLKTLTGEDIESALRTQIREYYDASVLRWPSYEERSDNDFSLIVGLALYDGEEARYRLWISEEGTLVAVSGTPGRVAIGIGADYAKILLDGLMWQSALSLDVLLSIYVLQKVKKSGLNVGKETHVLRVTRHTHGIFGPLVKKAEDLFAEYEDAATRTFATTIMEKPAWEGFDADADKTTISCIQSLREKFRSLLEEIKQNRLIP
ncbi:MAG TPA: hypothetical protein VMB18_05230 [Terriglobales bacterium]|nr:hypothetical protein [Terriglobales bacterium]